MAIGAFIACAIAARAQSVDLAVRIFGFYLAATGAWLCLCPEVPLYFNTRVVGTVRGGLKIAMTVPALAIGIILALRPGVVPCLMNNGGAACVY